MTTQNLDYKKVAFLISRVQELGKKLDAKMDAGIVPSKAECAFFDKAVNELVAYNGPSHPVREAWLHLQPKLVALLKKGDRSSQLRALAALEQAHREAIAEDRRRSIKKLATPKTLVAEFDAAKAPKSKRGLPVVDALPAAWADEKVVA